MDKQSDKLTPLDYYLKPGYIYLPDQPAVISTVLGSSVSVSLFDRSMKAGGMNHFLYPYAPDKTRTTALYGNIAVTVLIRMMVENGSKRSNLEAQIFGGAFNPLTSDRDIGRDNLKTARNVLLRQGVKVVSEDSGGAMGRKVVFNTQSNEILTLKVDRLRESDWYPYEGGR